MSDRMNTAERASEAVRSKQISEWCERTAKRVQWPGTLRVDFTQCRWGEDEAIVNAQAGKRAVSVYGPGDRAAVAITKNIDTGRLRMFEKLEGPDNQTMKSFSMQQCYLLLFSTRHIAWCVSRQEKSVLN